MIIQHNLSALNANRQLNIVSNTLTKSSEKLSSGYKINRAADDAAGLSISEKMRKQIRGLSQASGNCEDGISLCQVADGALEEVHEILQRLNVLAVQAANGTNSLSDRESIQLEVSHLKEEINRIGETTKFNDMKVFNGTENSSSAAKSNNQSNGTVGNLKYSFSYNLDISKYNNLFNYFDFSFSSSMNKDRKFDENHLLQTIINAGMTINAGDAVTIYEEHETIDTGGHRHRVYAINNNTQQKINLTYISNGTHVWTRPQYISNIYYSAAGTTGFLVEYKVSTKSGNDIPDDILDDIFTNKDNFSFTFTFDNDGSQADNNIYENYKNEATGNFWIQTGAHSGEGMFIHPGSLCTNSLGITSLNVFTESSASFAIDQLNNAIAKLSAQRSRIGAEQNRLESAKRIDDNIVENTTFAESQIRDTDMASEMVKHSNNTILAQAGQSMLAQANQSNQGVLSLIA